MQAASRARVLDELHKSGSWRSSACFLQATHTARRTKMQKLFSREAKVGNNGAVGSVNTLVHGPLPPLQPASNHPLALFYYCDTAVTHQMDQLNSLMRTTPDNLGRRSRLIAELKESQHNMITVLQHITSQLIPVGERESLDFRVKYSDEVQMDQINGKHQKLL